MENKVIGKPGESFLSYLSDGEIDTLVDFGRSQTYEILRHILEKIEKNHLAYLIALPINKERMYELAERRGMHIEDKRIIDLPELAKSEKAKRNKLSK